MTVDDAAGDGAVPDDRIWASRWYRITPRSFVHVELFFDPDRVVYAFAGESYKSFLLRRDGREDHAHELGAEYRELPASRLLEDERHEATRVADLQEIRVTRGSLLRKPKLVVVEDGRERVFYHYSRTHEVDPLATALAKQYPSVPVILDGERL